MKQSKRKIKYRNLFIFVVILVIITGGGFFVLKNLNQVVDPTLTTMYIASNTKEVVLYNLDYEETDKIIRGSEVQAYEKNITNDETNKTYKKIKYNNDTYLVNLNNIVSNKDEVVLENKLYVLTTTTVYENPNKVDINGVVTKETEVEITGFSGLDDSGNVLMYKIKSGNNEGYVYPKYLVTTKEAAKAVYDAEGNYKIHKARGDEAAILDFYPREKPKFTDNVMPDEVRALYLNTAAIKEVEKYIELAKNSNINAFVVDIKEDTQPGYASPVMQELSPTSYSHANNTFDAYKNYIKKLKDAGFYVIGRITTFKDAYYIKDHPESAIASTSNNQPYKHNSSYWPSAFRRDVWEYNVKLAVEAVTEMGFNEIQFDYIRFPDGTSSLQAQRIIDMKNVYDEYRSEAIQLYAMYAADELHKVGAYMSADVFGESAHAYTTSYGQYWGAISNVVDVISPMPYPDHFNPHQYNMTDVVWTVPYKLLTKWGNDYVQKRQKEIPTPAIVRSWIQTYNTTKEPAVIYDATKISEQIQALNDVGFTGGYMTWNAGSSYSKYSSIASAFKKEY